MALKIYEVEFADLKQAYFRCTSRISGTRYSAPLNGRLVNSIPRTG